MECHRVSCILLMVLCLRNKICPQNIQLQLNIKFTRYNLFKAVSNHKYLRDGESKTRLIS